MAFEVINSSGIHAAFSEDRLVGHLVRTGFRDVESRTIARSFRDAVVGRGLAAVSTDDIRSVVTDLRAEGASELATRGLVERLHVRARSPLPTIPGLMRPGPGEPLRPVEPGRERPPRPEPAKPALTGPGELALEALFRAAAPADKALASYGLALTEVGRFAVEAAVHGEADALGGLLAEAVEMPDLKGAVAERIRTQLPAREAPAGAVFKAGRAAGRLKETGVFATSGETAAGPKFDEALGGALEEAGALPGTGRGTPPVEITPVPWPEDTSTGRVWIKVGSLERRDNLGGKHPLWCRSPEDAKDELEGIDVTYFAVMKQALYTETDYVTKRMIVDKEWKVDLQAALPRGYFHEIPAGLSVSSYTWQLLEDDTVWGRTSTIQKLIEKAAKALKEKKEDIAKKAGESAEKLVETQGLPGPAGKIAKILAEFVVEWLIELVLELLDPGEIFPTLALAHLTLKPPGKVPLSWVTLTEAERDGDKVKRKRVRLAKPKASGGGYDFPVDEYRKRHWADYRDWLGAKNHRGAHADYPRVMEASRGTDHGVVWADHRASGFHCFKHQEKDSGRYVVALRAETYLIPADHESLRGLDPV